MKTDVYVQYGCGLCAPDGWLSFDVSPRLRFERLPVVGATARLTGKSLFPANVKMGDIRRGLPLKDGTVAGIYASHVLEHVSRNDVEVALRNTHSLLRSGGIFRMIVPDLAWRSERYVRDRQSGNAAAADAYIKALNIGETDTARGVMGILRAGLGNSGHRWMYDEAAMRALLEKAGFVDIRRCTIGDSGDPMFDKVEERGRFFDSGEAELAMQARKA